MPRSPETAMLFDSYKSLPDHLSAHEQLQWQSIESRLAEALRESGFQAKDPYFVKGLIRLADQNMPVSLRYSDEGHSWCEDCAKAIQAGAIRQWQSHLKSRSKVDDALTEYLDRDPASFSWEDLELFFEDYPERAPQVCECDDESSHDMSCHGCDTTLNFSCDGDMFQMLELKFGDRGLNDLTPKDVFCILEMMDYMPGGWSIATIARKALAVIDENGLPAPVETRPA